MAFRSVTLVGFEVSLDYLNRSFRTLYFACPAHQAFIDLNWDGLLFFDFVDGDGASINTCSAPGAFGIINYDLNHFKFHPMLFFHSEKECRIKVFRCT